MKFERTLIKFECNIPKYHKEKLEAISKDRQIFMSRLVGFAIDNELQKKVPFDFDVSLPVKNYQGFWYPAEATKIIDYMKKLTMECGIDHLFLLRFEIGIVDKAVFLAALKECIDGGLIEAYRPAPRRMGPKYPKDYVHYRIVGSSCGPKSRKIKERNDFNTYLALKAKFEDQGTHH